MQLNWEGVTIAVPPIITWFDSGRNKSKGNAEYVIGDVKVGLDGKQNPPKRFDSTRMELLWKNDLYLFAKRLCENSTPQANCRLF